MSDWLELELAHRLAPAKAPEALWERIENPRPAPPQLRPRWPIAAIVTLAVAAGALWMTARGESAESGLARLARLELHSSRPLDIAAGDPGALQAWSRGAAGLDLPLAPSSGVHLVGARLVSFQGEPVAAVSYRLDGKPAVLLVAQAAHRGNTPHSGIAMAGSDAACRICHRHL